MIKINLALRKQAAGVDFKEKGGGKTDILNQLQGYSEHLKDPRVRQFGLMVLVAVLASYVLDGWKQDQVKKQGLLFEKTQTENTRLKGELAKTASYDQQKKQFDADEELIKTKLATIQKLIADRGQLPKLLMSFSTSIPKDVWLTDLHLTSGDVKLKGLSLGFDSITDFMKALGDNEMVSEVKLDNSKKAKDSAVAEEASFELEAKRKQ